MKKHFSTNFTFLLFITWGMMSSSLFSVSYNSLLQAHESSWLFLEDLIIKQPKNQVDATFGIGGALILASGCSGVLTYKLTKYTTGTTSKLGKIGLGALGLSVGVFQHYALRKHLIEKAEREQMVSMMKMWTQIRDKLPYEVWSGLDSLQNNWLHDKESFKRNLDTTLSYLKAEVYGRFPNKYGDTTSPFFSRRNLHVQVTFDLYRALRDVVTTAWDLLT